MVSVYQENGKRYVNSITGDRKIYEQKLNRFFRRWVLDTAIKIVGNDYTEEDAVELVLDNRDCYYNEKFYVPPHEMSKIITKTL